MEYKYPNLCKPITLGRTTFRNRMFSAPMGGTDITNDGCIGPKSTAFYELRAKGGAAAVTVSELMVHPSTDGSHAYHLDESILNSLACATYTADAIRRHGAIPSIELSHSGMYSGTYMTDKNKQHGMTQWGPSACIRPDGVQVGELTVEMIDDIVAAYAHVAGLVKRAGLAHQPVPVPHVQQAHRRVRRFSGKPLPFRHSGAESHPRGDRALLPHRIPAVRSGVRGGGL